ncbi:hypothetical protein D3C72_464400 [compost metagenome]
MQEDLTFVIGGSPGIQLAVPDCGFKWRGLPQMKGVNRLYIIVSIDQDGWLAGCMKMIGIDNRMSFGFVDLYMFKSGCSKRIGYPGGGFGHIRFVFGKCGDTWYGKQLFQLIQVLLPQALEVSFVICSHSANPPKIRYGPILLFLLHKQKWIQPKGKWLY